MYIYNPFIFNTGSILPPTNGLVGWWKFDEALGSIAHDSSPTGNDMTLQGTSSNFWIIGKKNGAVNLTGTSSQSMCFSGNPEEIKVSKFTISIWVNLPDISMSGYNGLFVKQLAWGIFLINGLIGYYDWGGARTVVSTSTLIPNTWQNITLTRDSSDGRAKIYIDGILILEDYITISSHDSGISIGAGSTAGIQKVSGYYDQALLYNRILTDAEIAIISK